MIKTESAYKKAIEKLKEDLVLIERQKKQLIDMGLSSEEVARVIAPYISFHEQLKEEVTYYERIKRGEFDTIYNLNNLGKTLIAYRIYIGMSQSELAGKLGVSESQVSRDERNEYYGATLERLQYVMEALGMVSKTEVNPPELMLA